MPRSTTSFLFPDVNVWIALTYRRHIHYTIARMWLDSVPDDSELGLCRLTQLESLRLLTTPAVMGNRVMSQAVAWQVYDDWLEMVALPLLRNRPQSSASSALFPNPGSLLQRTGQIPTSLPLHRIPACGW